MIDRLGAEAPDLRGRLFHTDDPSVVDAAEAVLCFEVLEHVRDPHELAGRLPGRVPYATVPNPNRWYPALTKRYEAWDYPPNHLHRFSGSDLEALLRRARYSSVSIEVAPMRARDLLMPFSRKVNVADYDRMRESRTWYRTLAGSLLIPAARPVARLFGAMGYEGGSFYVKATR
jgi:hypothetical protein